MGLVAGWAMVVVPWHFGAMHPAEKPLAFALAIAPFVVLFVVIAIRRRQDGVDEEAHQAPPPTADERPDG